MADEIKGRSVPEAESGDDSVSLALVRTAKRHRSVAATLYAPHGIHPGQDMVIDELWRAGDRTLGQLAAALQIEAPTVSRTVERLERSGLVEKRRSTTDGRSTLVSLSVAGREAHLQWQHAWRELERRTTARLRRGEQAELIRLLRLVNDGLDD